MNLWMCRKTFIINNDKLDQDQACQIRQVLLNEVFFECLPWRSSECFGWYCVRRSDWRPARRRRRPILPETEKLVDSLDRMNLNEPCRTSRRREWPAARACRTTRRIRLFPSPWYRQESGPEISLFHNLSNLPLSFIQIPQLFSISKLFLFSKPFSWSQNPNPSYTLSPLKAASLNYPSNCVAFPFLLLFHSSVFFLRRETKPLSIFGWGKFRSRIDGTKTKNKSDRWRVVFWTLSLWQKIECLFFCEKIALWLWRENESFFGNVWIWAKNTKA